MAHMTKIDAKNKGDITLSVYALERNR